MNKTTTSSNRSNNKTSRKTKPTKAAALPHLSKSELSPRENFSEYHHGYNSEAFSTLWVIIVAFVILAALSFVVWLVFSGRTDQTIHGDNFNQLQSKL